MSSTTLPTSRNPGLLPKRIEELLANYLIDTGAADTGRIDEAELIMFPSRLLKADG